ncbi:DUF1963 domain-containing protein [Brevibacillus borstelensis]|nr:DUF1963 domain-containing protein [Brevibacillus borstelensis]
MKMKHEILTLFRESGLDAYADKFEPLIRPSYRIFTQKVPDEHALPSGASKICGMPDLPAGESWPYWRSYPLSFIAQINLAELPPLADPILPKQGLLLFFYAASAMYGVKGFYDTHQTAKVLYVPDTAGIELIRTAPPEELEDCDPEAVFSPASVSFLTEWTIPPGESADIAGLGMSWSTNREDYDLYWDVFGRRFDEKFQHPDDMKNRLLGCPDPMQGDMQVHCVRLLEGADRKSEEDLLARASQWRLLFQVDSEDDKTGMMWEDVGRLYFWIEQDALERLDFSRVVCDVQGG